MLSGKLLLLLLFYISVLDSHFMYRIDDNTYIDETLISCAEYQLFVNEMRGQEKYVQPDHWNSFHYPSHQAHFPVLGVRVVDAKLFCEWLNNRIGENWKFRIPTSKEAIDYPVQVNNHSSF